MVFGFRKSDTKQLVLSLGSFDVSAHLFGVDAQVLALVFEVLDLFVIFLLDIHQALELLLVPFELLLKANNSHVLRQFRILLLRFGLQELELFLNFVHVRLEGKPKVVLVLPENVD